MTINPISGSTDISQWLSAGWVYDAVELDGPIATPVITYVGGDPLVISGTSEPLRNIALTLDGSIPAGNTVAAADGTWSITYNASTFSWQYIVLRQSPVTITATAVPHLRRSPSTTASPRR